MTRLVLLLDHISLSRPLFMRIVLSFDFIETCSVALFNVNNTPSLLA